MTPSAFFRSDSLRKSCVGVLAAIALTITGYSGVASAALVECGDACRVDINVRINGLTVSATTQHFTIGADGQFFLTPHIMLFGDWGSVMLSELVGNVDHPSVKFRGESINNSFEYMSVDYQFLVPTSLEGPVVARSRLEYLPSELVYPFDSRGILIASDLGSEGFVSKGVDIGQTCYAYLTPICNATKTGAPFGDGDTFSAMQVNVRYNIPGRERMSFNGEVIQNAIPEPSSYGLLIAGLAFLGLVARRRLSS